MNDKGRKETISQALKFDFSKHHLNHRDIGATMKQ